MKKYCIIIFIASIFLIMFGSYLVMSASSTYSIFKHSNQFYLFNDHLIKALLAVLMLIIFSMVPYHIYKEYSKPLMFIAVFLLVFTLVASPETKGVRRWINLGFFSFQPSDFARMALIIHLSVLLHEKGRDIENIKEGLIYPLIWIMVIAGLIFLQPNVSNGVMILMLGFTILFIGGARLKHLSFAVGAGAGAAAMVAMIFSHSRERILTFLESLGSGGEINIQVKQAVLGLGSGGLFGVGFGHSNQRNLFLPEAYSDFIFAILGEETGFAGTVLILGIYLTIFLLGILIAKNAKDRFGQMLAFSISLMFIAYAFINVSVATGLLPTTGLPLPLISHGGTSLLVVSVAIGILINIGFLNSSENKEELELNG